MQLMNRKKIIVTGGAGFIGSHTVVELYHAGFLPIIMDNFSNSNHEVLKQINALLGTTIPSYELDCTLPTDWDQVFEAEKVIEAVIHFAAFKWVGESVRNPLKYHKNNIGSMIAMLECMEKWKITKLVFSSSCTIYGQPTILPVNETAPEGYTPSPYGYTKQVCERILDDVIQSESHLQAITLRYFNPIGAHPSGLIGELPTGVPENLIPYVTQTAIGKREKLSVYGTDWNTPDGTCLRDYIHVCDLALAHVKALNFLTNFPSEDSHNEVFNLGMGRGISVKEIITTFEKVSNQTLPVIFTDRRPGDIEKIWADTTKASEVLNFDCSYSIADALLHAWQWEKNLNSKSIS